jgi:DNA primase
MEAFELGLSPLDWHGLTEHLSARGYSVEQQALAGLVTQGRSGRYRDLFRGRLVFPIRDAQGRLVGFGGRALDDSEPKYLNTPQSPVFNKGRLLYGLYKARDSIREGGEAVVVEGYTDVIGTHQEGFTNTVASMGTSLTDDQVSLLQRIARTVVLALDPDMAGQEATLRSLESSWRIFQRQTVGRIGDTTLYQRPDTPELKVAVMPEGHDPDEIALDNPDEWRQLVARSMPLMEYLFTSLASRFDLSSPQGKSQVAQLLFPMVAALSNPFEQDRYFQRLAAVLEVSEQTLAASMGRPRPNKSRPTRTREPVATPFERLEHDPLEELCLSLLFHHPELASSASKLRVEHFKRVENRELFTYWIQDASITTIGESVDPELKTHLERLLSREVPSNTDAERQAIIEDCLRRLEQRRLRDLKVEEEFRLAEVSKEEFFESEQQVLELTERIKRLFHTNLK